MFNKNKKELEMFEVKIIRKIYHDEKTGFYIGMTDTGRKVKVQSAVLPILGDVTIAGNIEFDEKYKENQLVASKVYVKDPKQATGILLSGGYLTGIRKEKAIAVITTLGDYIFEVLEHCIEEEPEKRKMVWKGQTKDATSILLSVKGIGPVVAQQVIDSYRSKRNKLSAALIAVQAGLTMYQFRNALLMVSPAELIHIINNETYKLTMFNGFDFETVDLIAHLKWEGKTPVDHNSPIRFAAVMREIIERNKLRGHMVMEANEAITAAIELAKPTNNVNFWDSIKDILEAEGLVLLQYSGAAHITTKLLFDTERMTAETFGRLIMNGKKFIDYDFSDIDVQPFAEFELSSEQKDAVHMALNSNISIVTGGPGTGKTTGFLKTFLNILEKYQVSYTLCAPTGKAAIRMQESVSRTAGTLHREFRLFEDKPESCQTNYLVIDEASMISADIMKKITEVIRNGCRVVFIGDTDQLPPVGPGEPLMQMIDSSIIPVVRLKTIYRQGKNSGIIVAAHDVNHGIVPTTSENGDFVVANISPSNVYRELIYQIQRFIALGYGLQDIVVLTPVNNNQYGRFTLNKSLQDYWNSSGIPIKGTFFRLGDPVIQNKNDYQIMVMNGQTGIITSIPDEDVETLGLSFDDEKEPPIMGVTFEMMDEETPISKSLVGRIESAYALTIHKTQGSQYRVVIVITPPVYEGFYLRQLVYTGITRASEMCTVIDVNQSMRRYVENETILRRKSLLSEMLTYYINLEKENDTDKNIQ